MHNIELYNPAEHDALVCAAALEGIDCSPAVEATRYIGYGNTKYGYGPACILDLCGTEHVAEPHVIWFPWLSAADKIVNFKWAMGYLAESREVFLTVQKDQISFFEHFVKRGILRKVGYLKNLPIVEEIHMYQYERSVQ